MIDEVAITGQDNTGTTEWCQNDITFHVLDRALKSPVVLVLNDDYWNNNMMIIEEV